MERQDKGDPSREQSRAARLAKEVTLPPGEGHLTLPVLCHVVFLSFPYQREVLCNYPALALSLQVCVIVILES